ncbi:hypothetical protein EON63_15650 [archaeon]|nr:MAG: hypothetical protein EON63_15650 [archaeon]
MFLHICVAHHKRLSLPPSHTVDPDYLATQEHFTDMFRRYGAPVIVLDLVKQVEKKGRESIVGREYRTSIEVGMGLEASLLLYITRIVNTVSRRSNTYHTPYTLLLGT